MNTTTVSDTARHARGVSRPSSTTMRFVARTALYAILVGSAAFFVMPLLVMAFASFKNMAEIRSTSILSFPLAPTVQPWIDAWQNACVGIDCVGLHGFYVRTVLIVVPSVVLSTLLGALNGYALTKFNFRGSKFVYAVILFGTFTPYQSVLIPLAKTLGVLGLSGSLAGLVLVHTVYGLPFTTMFFRNYFMTVPQDLVKAARVDGAGFWTTFAYIILPLSVPMIVVTVIWQFTSIWNDFLFGVSFTSGQNTPIMVALNNMVSASAGERPYNVHMAGALLAALPTLVIYFLAGKYFVRGLMAGAVKG
ncbi:carbohydrate ABC transporter permease [Burkholderia contaminans]|uniref:carbohydrate ABC transporter permease n=1 Tax=Burkholderia contaminans TaxID=488447 RepID=UPI000F5B3AC5|nr:carbohydrate ABC transporter permease [Burkholderia contaminans]MCA8156656.1 carbohydrate ABC transporter permease [Burkholderia contaminans]RQT06418.1 carbohydrate ABC transporter permease [Burkholderia contaminans]